MVNYNDLITGNNNQFLYDLFSNLFSVPLTTNKDTGEPLLVCECTGITVTEPTRSFDECLKLYKSYAYDIDAYVEVVDDESGEVVDDFNISLKIPKMYQGSFFFQTNPNSVPRVRIPGIIGKLRTTVNLYDDVLSYKDSEGNYKSINITELQEDIVISDLSKGTKLKLSYIFNRPIDKLTTSDIKGILNDDEMKKRAKEKFSIDYEYNTVDMFLKKEFFNARYKVMTNLSRLYSRNNGVIRRTSSIQAIINRVFSVGMESGFSTEDETNSLATQLQSDKIYFSDNKGGKKRIDYNNSFIGLICPVDTPETNLINKKNEKAIGAEFLNGIPYIKVYTKNWEETSIPMEEFMSSKVLISDCIDYSIRKVTGLKCKYGINQQIITVDSEDSIDYYETERYNRLSYGVSVIPGVNSTDQIKAHMGSRMIGQSTSVEGSEPALVYTGTEGLINQVSKRSITSPVSGRISEVGEDYYVITDVDGKDVTVNIPSPRRISDGTSLVYDIGKFKTGDIINEGEIISYTDDIKMDEFSTGVNLKCAWMNYMGYDHLDGIILTEKSVKKFTITRTESVEVILYKDSNPVFDFQKINEEYDGLNDENLDLFGLPILGEKYNERDVCIAYISNRRSKFSVDTFTQRLGVPEVKFKQFPYGANNSEVFAIDFYVRDSYKDKYAHIIDHLLKQEQKVYSFEGEGDEVAKIVIHFTYKDTPKVGDKFSNRYGSKGVLGYIIPENEIPIDTFDGREIEVIMAPEATPKRKNPSQLVSSELGRIAVIAYQKITNTDDYDEKRRILTIIYNKDFSSYQDKEVDMFISRNSIEGKAMRIQREALDYTYTPKKISEIFTHLGIEEKSYIYLPKFGKNQRNPVLVGEEYLMRLHFIVQDKAKATSSIGRSVNSEFVSGFGSHRSGGQSLSEMILWSLMSNNAMDVYDYLTDNASSKLKDEFINELAWIGLKVENS